MTTSNKRQQPYGHTRMAEFLDHHIDSLAGVVSQREIATALGYPNPNIISMFKKGHAKVPLEKLLDPAAAIRVDPTFLIRLGLDQYWPGKLDVLNSIFDRLVTQNECALVDRCRQATGNGDFHFPEETLEQIEAILTAAVASETRSAPT